DMVAGLSQMLVPTDRAQCAPNCTTHSTFQAIRILPLLAHRVIGPRCKLWSLSVHGGLWRALRMADLSVRALVLRPQRKPADRAVLDQADPELRRAVDEMGDVDVAAHGRNGAERQGSQCAEPCENGLVERKLPTRIRRHFGGHAVIVRLTARNAVDVLTQHRLAAGLRRRSHAALRTRTMALDGAEARLLPGQQDLQALARRVGKDPRTADIGRDRR